MEKTLASTAPGDAPTPDPTGVGEVGELQRRLPQEMLRLLLRLE